MRFFKKKNIILFFLCLNLLFQFDNSYDLIELSFSQFLEGIEESDVIGGKTYKVSYMKGEITQNYFRISASHEETDNIFMYFSYFSEKREDAALVNSEFQQDVSLYINKGFITEEADGEFYLTVSCYNKKCRFNLSVLELDEIDLSRDGSYTYFVTDKKNTQNTFKIIRTDSKSEEGLLTFWATGSKNIKMTVLYIDEEKGKEINIKVSEHPIGKITIINEEDYPIDKSSNRNLNYFLLDIISEPNSLVTVGSKLLQTESEKWKKLKPNYRELQGLLTSIFSFECYDLGLESGKNQKYYLNINDYKKSIEVQLKEKFSREITKTFEISDGMATIELTSDYSNCYICFTKKNEILDESPFTFQLTDLSTQGNYVNIYAHQVDGYFYERYLNPGQITFFTGLPSLSFKTEYRFNLKVISGYPKMYFVKCKTYPNCQFDIASLPMDTITPKEVNGIFTYSLFPTEMTSPIAEQQYILLAYCQTNSSSSKEPCRFETNFFSELDIVILRENTRFYHTIATIGQTTYSINLNNAPDFSQIFVNFLIFTGDISINYLAKGYKVKNYLSGNKNYFVIDKSSNDLSSEIFFYVTGISASHYSIDFKYINSIKDKTSLKGESGVSYLETIEPKIGYKTITLTNRKKEDKKNFLVNFFPLNCQISVKRQYKTKETELEIIDYLAQDIFIRTSETEEEYDNGEYSYYMKIIKMDNVTAFDHNWCMIYISSIEQNGEEEDYKQKQLTVSEGVANRVILSKDFPNIQFIYPHTKLDGHIVINFNMEIESKLNIKIYLEGKIFTKFDMGKSRYYIIEENKIRSSNFCPKIETRPEQACNIVVEINLDPYFYSDEPIINFIIKSKENIPSFVRKSMLRQDVIVGNFYQYFFSEVGKKEEGEVIVSFNRGRGNIFGRLVSKDVNEGSGWMGRFILPDEKNNELNYNHYTKKLYFGEFDTEKCEVGCYLLLKVEHNLTDQDFIKEDIGYPISISIHANDATILTITPDLISSVNIPINEYIIGSTIPLYINVLKDYYNFWIPYDCEELIFDLQSDSCKLLVNIGAEKPTNLKYDFIFGTLGQDSIFRISKSQILKKLRKKNEGSIKNIELTLGVSASYIDDENSSIYSFRIRALRKNEIEIIQITSDQKSLCKFKGNFGNCYFLLPHHRKIDENTNFFFYALEEANVEFNYYADIADQNIIVERDPEKIKEILPNENSKWNSKYLNSNYLYIDNGEIERKEQGIYIILNIEVKTQQKKDNETTIVNLINEVYSYKGTILPNPTSAQLFSTRGSSIKFNFLTERQNIIVHIVAIEGTGFTLWEDPQKENNPIYYLNNPGDSVDMTLGTSDIFPLRINSTCASLPGNPRFAFYLYYNIESQQENYNKLIYGSSSKISFKDTDFPFIFYSKIPDKEHEIEVIIKLDRLINLKINSLETEIISEAQFDITGVVTEEELIYEKKGNHYINPPDKNKIIGNYDIASKVGRVQFTPSNIKKFDISGNNYLYIIINKSYGNTQKYREVSMECSILPSNKDGYFAPINQYNYAKIPFSQEGFSRYELNRIGNQNKFMRIEFATNTEKISFALIDHYKTKSKDINYYKNNTNMIEKEVYGGKSVIVIEFNDEDINSVFLSVFNNENSKHINNQEKLSNFLFRYNLSETDEFSELKPDKGNINYTFTNKIINLTIPAIKGNNKMREINFYAKLLSASEIVKGEKLSTICQIESKTFKLFKKSSSSNNTGEFMELRNIMNDRLYYIVVIAEVFEENDAEFFSYQAIYNPTNYNPNKDKEANKSFVIIIIIVSIIAFIVILIILLIFLKYKKANLRLSQQFNELNSRLQSQNVIIDS